jgi:IS30 family transposase
VIPQEDVKQFLIDYYNDPETGYQSHDRLFAWIYQDYYGVSRRDIATFLQNLETAQIHQQPKHVKVSQPLVLRAPRSAYACDLTWLKEVDPESMTNVEKDSQIVFTCMDMFSKYAWAEILPNKTAKTVAAALKRIFTKDGAPKTMHMDNGSKFIANEFSALLSEFHVKHILSDVYNP